MRPVMSIIVTEAEVGKVLDLGYVLKIEQTKLVDRLGWI